MIVWLTEGGKRKLRGRETRIHFQDRKLQGPRARSGNSKIIKPGNDALVWRTINGARVLIKIDGHGNGTVVAGPRGLKGKPFNVKPLTPAGDDVGQESSKNPKRSIEQLVALAKDQENWRDWYDRNEKVIREVMGDDAELFSDILAATSQAATVKSNFSLALDVYKAWYDPNDPGPNVMSTVAKNLQNIREGRDIEGGKISQYAAALGGDKEAIAVDRHISRIIFGDDDTSSNRGLGEGRVIVRAVADELEWSGREVQSALWAADQVLSGTNPKDVVSYDTLFAEREAEISAAIRQVEAARQAAAGSAG